MFKNLFWNTYSIFCVCTRDYNPNTLAALLGIQLMIVALVYDWSYVKNIINLHAFVYMHKNDCSSSSLSQPITTKCLLNFDQNYIYVWI